MAEWSLNNKTLGFLLFVILLISGCAHEGEPGSTPPPTPQPPEYDLQASIKGNIVDYKLKYEEGPKPEELWITLLYHDDLSISGLNIVGNQIILDPEQSLQGDPYSISGGNDLVLTYTIGLMLSYKPYGEEGPTQLPPKWLHYTP